MAKNPYSFPARSRAAMIAAMESVGGYSGWNAPSRNRYPFAWNVKIYRFASTARELEEHNDSGVPFNRTWDSAWDKETESEYFFGSICEGMAREVLEGDYTTYPGDDQGEFAFSIAGRSGGHLVLTRAFGNDMAGFDFDDLRDVRTEWGVECSDWSFADVRKLYRAVMTMESDFASDKVQREFAWHVAQRRATWEGERRDQIAAALAEASDDRDTARRLLLELRGLRRLPGLGAFRESCDTLRRAIRNALGDARDTRRAALALIDGESE